MSEDEKTDDMIVFVPDGEPRKAQEGDNYLSISGNVCRASKDSMPFPVVQVLRRVEPSFLRAALSAAEAQKLKPLPDGCELFVPSGGGITTGGKFRQFLRKADPAEFGIPADNGKFERLRRIVAGEVETIQAVLDWIKPEVAADAQQKAQPGGPSDGK